MVQARREPRFVHEHSEEVGLARELPLQDFHDEELVDPRRPGREREVDGRGASLAELGDDAVLAEGARRALEGIAHTGSPGRRASFAARAALVFGWRSCGLLRPFAPRRRVFHIPVAPVDMQRGRRRAPHARRGARYARSGYIHGRFSCSRTPLTRSAVRVARYLPHARTRSLTCEMERERTRQRRLGACSREAPAPIFDPPATLNVPCWSESSFSFDAKATSFPLWKSRATVKA